MTTTIRRAVTLVAVAALALAGAACGGGEDAAGGLGTQAWSTEVGGLCATMFDELGSVDASAPIASQIDVVVASLEEFAAAADRISPPEDRAEEQLELIAVADRGAQAIAATGSEAEAAQTAAAVGEEFRARGDQMGLTQCAGPDDAASSTTAPPAATSAPDDVAFATQAEQVCVEATSQYSDTLAGLASDPVAAAPGLNEFVTVTLNGLNATPAFPAAKGDALVSAVAQLQKVTAGLVDAINAQDQASFTSLATEAFPAAGGDVDAAAKALGAPSCAVF